jgi:chaperonin GroES
MKVFPSPDRILVKQVEAATKSKGGLYLPPSTINGTKINMGEVIAVGDDKILESGEHRPVPYKVGENVIFDQYAGSPVKINGVDHLILLSDDVMARAEFEPEDDLSLVSLK